MDGWLSYNMEDDNGRDGDEVPHQQGVIGRLYIFWALLRSLHYFFHCTTLFTNSSLLCHYGKTPGSKNLFVVEETRAGKKKKKNKKYNNIAVAINVLLHLSFGRRCSFIFMRQNNEIPATYAFAR